jgi:hypothetical protein
LLCSVFSVEGVDSARLEPPQPVLAQVPIPVPAAADAIFTAEALSTLHALAHCNVGAVPVVPFWPVKLAPVLDRVSEFAASV